jgi:microcystin-dependent protein
MGVPTILSDISISAANNSPAGTDAIGTTADDYFRSIQAVIRAGLAHKGADIASATTTDLGAVAGFFHDITGTTTITGLGTVSAGIPKAIKFEGALTLTHNATSLILPGAANITTADGDVAWLISEGSGNWRCLHYQKASGIPIQPVPAGTMADFAGTSAPTGWLACDGSAVSRTTYAALFTAISTTWGVGDGSTTFNVPDFRRRVAVGSGGSGTATLANSVGSTGGAETHTLTSNEMPAHTHSVDITSTGGSLSMDGAGTAQHGSVTTGSTGGGAAHNNMQPSAVVLKIIKT